MQSLESPRLVVVFAPLLFSGIRDEMNRALGHFSAHTGYIRSGEPPKDDEMSEMTLPSSHRIRNSNPGGLRLSALPLGHGGSPTILSFTM